MKPLYPNRLQHMAAALLVPLITLAGCSDDAEPVASDPESAAPWESPDTMAATAPVPADSPDEKMPMEDPAAATGAGDDSAADVDTGKPADASKAAAAIAEGDGKGAADKTDPPEAPAEKKPAAGPVKFNVATAGTATFLIDAPLEKIKGKWTRFGGHLMIDVDDINATRGHVLMDLGTLRTHTFGDPGKDQRQTGHALNWLEIGPDVEPARRKSNSVARFDIESVSGATGTTGEQKVTAQGKLMLHGHTLPKTVQLLVTFEGPADAPTGVSIKTAAPMIVSLEGHDVKPRDLAGRFLAGALEKVGEKVTDTTQVMLDVKAAKSGE